MLQLDAVLFVQRPLPQLVTRHRLAVNQVLHQTLTGQQFLDLPQMLLRIIRLRHTGTGSAGRAGWEATLRLSEIKLSHEYMPPSPAIY